MNIPLKIGTRARSVQIRRTANRLEFSLDGKGIAADVVAVEPGAYSLLLAGEAFEVRIEPTAGGARLHIDGREYVAQFLDPRQWRRGGGGAAGAEGRQNVIAAMPGKVVRVLVAPGNTVVAGQGLLVVEAMKMQNEIKSPKEGTVERINVAEGQPVNAGEVLAVIA